MSVQELYNREPNEFISNLVSAAAVLLLLLLLLPLLVPTHVDCCCAVAAAVGLAPLIGTTCKYLVSQPVFGPQQSRKIENAKLSAKQMKYNTKKVAESETERERGRDC